METLMENNNVEAMQARLKKALDDFDLVLAELELLNVDVESQKALSEEAKQVVNSLDKQ